MRLPAALPWRARGQIDLRDAQVTAPRLQVQRSRQRSEVRTSLGGLDVRASDPTRHRSPETLRGRSGAQAQPATIELQRTLRQLQEPTRLQLEAAASQRGALVTMLDEPELIELC